MNDNYYNDEYNSYTDSFDLPQIASGDDFSGKARCNYPSGAVYEGDFKKGLRHGKGTVHYPNGSSYVGEWKKDKRHGKGEFTYANGEKHIGKYKNGVLWGKGVYTYPSGITYEGDFKNGVREGYGVMKYADGSWYKGEWKNDKKHGKGERYHIKAKAIYKGNYAFGVREGYGVMKWENGSWYKGNFAKDQRSGYGVEFISKTGDMYKGYYLFDKKDGQGEMIWASGEKHIGTYQAGCRHGQGVYYYKDGRVFRGIYKNDLAIDGMYKKKDANGKWIETHYVREETTTSSGAIITKEGKATVYLKYYREENKLLTVKAIREFTGLGLKQAIDIVEGVPSVIMKNVNPAWVREKLDSDSKKLGFVYEIVE